MPRTGRPRKPDHLKALAGNPGRRRLAHDEPQYPAADPAQPPAYLTDLAREEWGRMAPHLKSSGLLTVADVTALAAYCESYATWRHATKSMNEQTVSKVFARWQRVQNIAFGQMTRLLVAFGFTPADRARLHVAPAKSEDPFERLLGRN